MCPGIKYKDDEREKNPTPSSVAADEIILLGTRYWLASSTSSVNFIEANDINPPRHQRPGELKCKQSDFLENSAMRSWFSDWPSVLGKNWLATFCSCCWLVQYYTHQASGCCCSTFQWSNLFLLPISTRDVIHLSCKIWARRLLAYYSWSFECRESRDWSINVLFLLARVVSLLWWAHKKIRIPSPRPSALRSTKETHTTKVLTSFVLWHVYTTQPVFPFFFIRLHYM